MSRNPFKGTDADQPGLAVILILSALVFLSFQDGLVKSSNTMSSLWQVQSLRAFFNLCLIFGGLTIAGQWALLRPRNPRAVVARTLALICTMVLFFSGSPFLTLAEMGAGLYTYPVFMTVLSALFLRERIGIWRIGAILVAAVGAYLIVRPGSSEFHIAQLLPIGAGLTYATNAIIVRRYCRAESPVTMAIWAGSGFLAISLVGGVLISNMPLTDVARQAWPFLLDPWPTLSLIVVGIAAMAACCNVAGNILIVKAYQSAELSWLAPIDYTYLIFAAFWGYVMFSDLPGGSTVLGMALIAIAGTVTALRERKSSQHSHPPTSSQS